MAEKTGFILHYDMLENIKLLGNDIAIEILSALSKYDQGLETGDLSPHAQFAFNAYMPTLKKSKKRWEASTLIKLKENNRLELLRDRSDEKESLYSTVKRRRKETTKTGDTQRETPCTANHPVASIAGIGHRRHGNNGK